MKSLQGKTAWVTGASSGIGEALSLQLANQGCQLIMSSNQPDELTKLEDKIRNMGVKCHSIPFDLSDRLSVKQAAEMAIKVYGRIDLLFNNGGISQRSLISETPEENDRKIMEINYFANISLTKAILPHLIAHGGGHIAVTSSLSGLFGFPLRSA